MSTKIITVKMKPDKPTKITFNPAILNAKSIQLIEYYNNFEGYMFFCDIIDFNFSLTNIDEINPGNYVNLNPSKLLAFFSDSKLY